MQAGHTIYNGIPLQQLNQFKQKEDRRKVRAALGYTDEDFVVLHLGTVCSRTLRKEVRCGPTDRGRSAGLQDVWSFSTSRGVQWRSLSGVGASSQVTPT